MRVPPPGSVMEFWPIIYTGWQQWFNKMDETVRILLDLQSGNNIFPYVMQKVDFFRGN